MLAVVKQIDIPRLQVAVDAIIVEISAEKEAELGVTWAASGGAGVDSRNFSGNDGRHSAARHRDLGRRAHSEPDRRRHHGRHWPSTNGTCWPRISASSCRA